MALLVSLPFHDSVFSVAGTVVIISAGLVAHELHHRGASVGSVVIWVGLAHVNPDI